MSDYVTLVGSEQVSNAGYKMAEAADTMNRAVGNLDDVLMRHQTFMREWLTEFQSILEADQKQRNPTQ